MSSRDQRKQRESGRGGTVNLPQSSDIEARPFNDEDSRVDHELDTSTARKERKEKRRKSSTSKKSRSDRTVERDPALSQSQQEIELGQNASDLAPISRLEISAGEGGPGLAAEYYGDAGESVAQQPGNRTHSPSLIVGAEPHLQPASSEAAPPIEPSQIGGTGAAASFYNEPFDDGINPNADQQTASHYSTAPSRPSQSHHSASAPAVGTLGTIAAGAASGYILSSGRPQHSRPNHSSNTNYEFSTNTSSSKPSRPGKASSYSSNGAHHAVDYAGGIAIATGAQSHGSHLQNSHVTHGQGTTSSGRNHQHVGPLHALVNFVKDPDGVAQYEEYTEYIGVCKGCFDRNSTPRDAPRKHRDRSRRSVERKVSSARVDKLRRYSSSDEESRRSKEGNFLGAGLAGFGLAKVGETLFTRKNDFQDTSDVKSGRFSPSQRRNAGRRSSEKVLRRDNDARPQQSEAGIHSLAGASLLHGGHQLSMSRSDNPDVYSATNLDNAGQGLDSVKRKSYTSPQAKFDVLNVSREDDVRRSRRKGLHKKGHKKKSKGFFNIFSASSSSSSEDLPSRLTNGKKTRPTVTRDKITNDSEAQAALVGLGAATAALAIKDPRVGNSKHRAPRPYEATRSKFHPSMTAHRPHSVADDPEEVWESASEGEAEQYDAGLAFGSPSRRASLGSDASSSSGTEKWGWRWARKDRTTRRSSRESTTQDSSRSGSIRPAAARKVDSSPPEHSVRHSNAEGEHGPLQYVVPVSTSDPGRFDARNEGSLISASPMVSTSKDLDIQQPRPVVPVSSHVYESQVSHDSIYGRSQYPETSHSQTLHHVRDLAPIDQNRTSPQNDRYEEVAESRKLRRRKTFPARLGEDTQSTSKTTLQNGSGNAGPSAVRFAMSEEQEESERRERRRRRRESKSERHRRDSEVKSSSRDQKQAIVESDSGRDDDASNVTKAAGIIGATAGIAAIVGKMDKKETKEERRERRRRERQREDEEDDIAKSERRQKREEGRYTTLTYAAEESDTTKIDVVPGGSGTRNGEDYREVATEKPHDTRSVWQEAAAPRRAVHEDYQSFFAPVEVLTRPKAQQIDWDSHGHDDDDDETPRQPSIVEIAPKIITVAPDEPEWSPADDGSEYVDTSSLVLPWHVPRLKLVHPTPPVSRTSTPFFETTEPLESAVAKPDVGSEQRESSDVPAINGDLVNGHFSKSTDVPPHGPDEIQRSPAVDDMTTEVEGHTASSTASNPQFDDDLEFAATLAASAQDAGFDPSIVIDDPSYRRRDSPPTYEVQEATSSSRRKKEKKRRKNAAADQDLQDAPRDAREQSAMDVSNIDVTLANDVPGTAGTNGEEANVHDYSSEKADGGPSAAAHMVGDKKFPKEMPEVPIAPSDGSAQSKGSGKRKKKSRRHDSLPGKESGLESVEGASKPYIANEDIVEIGTTTQDPQPEDRKLIEDEFPPADSSHSEGFNKPLNEGNDSLGLSDQLSEPFLDGRPEPPRPPDLQSDDMETADPTSESPTTHSRRPSKIGVANHDQVTRAIPSPTAVPVHFRRPRPLSGSLRSVSQSPLAQSITETRPKMKPRPRSTEFKASTEIRPLWLVERHQSHHEPEPDQEYPPLPESLSTSTASSILDPEDNRANVYAEEEVYGVLEGANKQPRRFVEPLGSEEPTPTMASFPANRRDMNSVSTLRERSQSRGALPSEDGLSHEENPAAPPISAMIQNQAHTADLAYPNEEPGSTFDLEGNEPGSIDDRKPMIDASYEKWSSQELDESTRSLPTKPRDFPPPATAESQDSEPSQDQLLVSQEAHRISKDMSPDVLLATMVSAAESQDTKIKDFGKEDTRIGLADKVEPAQDQSSVNSQLESAISDQDTKDKPKEAVPASAQRSLLNTSPSQGDLLREPMGNNPVSASTGLMQVATESPQLALEGDHQERTDASSVHPTSKSKDLSDLGTDQLTGIVNGSMTASTGDAAITAPARKKGKKGKKDKRSARSLHDPPKVLVVDNTDVASSSSMLSENSDRNAIEDQLEASENQPSLASIAEAYDTQDMSKHIDEPQVLLSDPLEEILAKDREEQLVKEGLEGLPDLSAGAIQSDIIESEVSRDLGSTPFETDEPEHGESSAKKEEVHKSHDQDNDLPSTDGSQQVMSTLDRDSDSQYVESGNKILPFQSSSSPQPLEAPPLAPSQLATESSKEQPEQIKTLDTDTTSHIMQPDAHRDFQDEVADVRGTSITGGESSDDRRVEVETQASNGEPPARTQESGQDKGQRLSEVTLKDDQFSASNDGASSNPIGFPEIVGSSINLRSQASGQVDAPLLEAGLPETNMGTEIPEYGTPSGQRLQDEIVSYPEPDANADGTQRDGMHQDPSDAKQRTMVGVSMPSSVKAREELTTSAPHRESSVEKSLEQIMNAEAQEEGIRSLDNVQSSAPVLVDDPPTREELSTLASSQASRGRSMSKKEKRKKSKSVAFDLGDEEDSKAGEPLHDSPENIQPDPMSLAANQETQRMVEDEALEKQISDLAPDIQIKDFTPGASDNTQLESTVPLPAVEAQPTSKKEKKKKKKSKGTVFDLGEETINDNDVPMEKPVAATEVITQVGSGYQDGIEKRKSDSMGQELPEARIDESMMVEEEPSEVIDTVSRIDTNSKKDKKSKKKSKSMVYDLGEENTGELAEPLDVVDTAAQDGINRKKDKKKKKKSKGIDYEVSDEKVDEMEPTGEPAQGGEPSLQDGFDLKKNKKKKKAKGVVFDLNTQDTEDVALPINEPPDEAYENKAAPLLDEPAGMIHQEPFQASNKKAKKKDKMTKASPIEAALDLSDGEGKSSPPYSAAGNLEMQSAVRSTYEPGIAAEEATTQDKEVHAHIRAVEQPINLQSIGSASIGEMNVEKVSRAADVETSGLESDNNMPTSDNLIANDTEPNDLYISRPSTRTDIATDPDALTSDLEELEKRPADGIISSHVEQGSEAEVYGMPVADHEVVVSKIAEQSTKRVTPPDQAYVPPATGEADGVSSSAPGQNDSRAHQERFFEANKDPKDQQSLVQTDDGRPGDKAEAVLEDPTQDNLGSRRSPQRHLSLDDPIDLKARKLQQQPSMFGQPSDGSEVLSHGRLEDTSATESTLHEATIEAGEGAMGPSSSFSRHNANAANDVGFQEKTQGEGNGVSRSPGQSEQLDLGESPTSDAHISKESFTPTSILDKGTRIANPIDTPLSAGSIDLLDAEQQRQYNEEYARELKKHLAADQDNEFHSAEAQEEAAAQGVELSKTLNDDTASRQLQESSENVNILEPNDNRSQHTIEDIGKDRRGDAVLETLTRKFEESKEEQPSVETKPPIDDVLAALDVKKPPSGTPKVNENVPHEQSHGVAEAIGDASLSPGAQHGTDYFDYQPSSRAEVNVGAQDDQLLAADQHESASSIPAHDETKFEHHDPAYNKELVDPETVEYAKGQASQLHGSRKDSKKDRKKKNRKKPVFVDDIEAEQFKKQSPKPEASALANVATSQLDASQPQELSADLRNKDPHFYHQSRNEGSSHVSRNSDAGEQIELLPADGSNDHQENTQPIPTSSTSQSILLDDLAENVIINKHRQAVDQEHSPPKVSVAKSAGETTKQDESINDAGNSPYLGYDGDLQQKKLRSMQSYPKDPRPEGGSASRRSRRTSGTHYDSDDSADSGFDVQKRRRKTEALSEERKPSPVDSTSKDRSSVLFESSPFSNEASKLGQVSKGDDQTEALRETVDIDPKPSWSFARLKPEDDTPQPSLFGGSPASDAAVPAIGAQQIGSLHAEDVSNDRSRATSKPSMAKDSAKKDKRRASGSNSQSANSMVQRSSGTDHAGFKESPLSMLKALSTHFEQPDIRDSSKREFDAHSESKGSRRASQQSTASAAPSIESVHAYIHTPDRIRSPSGQSFRSTGTPPLRRVDHSVSSDLRAASRKSSGAGVLTPTFEEEGDARKRANRKITGQSGSRSPLQDQQQIPYASSSKYNPLTNKGKNRAGEDSDMADYEGWGDVRGQSPISPTRPPSLRKLQSMQFTEMEQRYAILASENSLLSNAKLKAEKRVQEQEEDHSQLRRNYEDALKEHKSYVAERDGTVRELNTVIDALREEVAHLTEVQVELTQSRELAVQARDAQLTVHHRADVEEQLDALRVEKTREVESLRRELDNAKEQIRKLQEQILASKSSEDLVERDEDYFDSQCQELFKHLTSWVTRFSKLSDTQRCYLASEMRNEAHRDLFEDSMLDGSEVDDYLQDRHRRRDIFMSVTMSLMFKHIFARYLFGMDREHRQKLKALDSTLQEVGPPSAVHKWRATTLTLLSRRPAFQSHRETESEGVLEDIWSTLATALPPPSTAQADQCRESLRRIINLAVDLSIDMRLQRAEYSMLPPPEAEFDPETGDIKNRLYFLSTSMNDRSAIDYSNEELENHGAYLRIVLFPLVVKNTDDEDHIVVCPAQVHVAPIKKGKTVRVMSAADNRSDEASFADGEENGMEGGMF